MKNLIIGLITALAILILGYGLGSFGNGRYQPVPGVAIERFDTRTGETEIFYNDHWISIQTSKE